MSAELCACTSCRVTSGFEVTSWTHVARHKIRFTSDGKASGQSVDDALNTSDRFGLGHYESSPDTHRYFCRRCGAKVFYDRVGAERVDVALGVFEAQGSRAEDWFAWNPDREDVSFLGEAVDMGFVGALADAVGARTRDVGMERVET
jgi:hypothetical protein